MQSKEDIAVKYANALNRIRCLERSVVHWRGEAEYHLWKSKRRGLQIFFERRRRVAKLSFINKMLAKLRRPQYSYGL